MPKKGYKVEGAARYGQCSLPECSKLVGRKGSKGMCCAHACSMRRNAPADPLHPCAVSGCARRVTCKGRCTFHYARAASGIPDGHAFKRRRVRKSRFKAPGGYVYALVNGQKVMEHRHVMSQILGRALFDHETVHHLNGVRDDNRPSNLELWSHSQPYGQRVEDKIKWARELLALYENLKHVRR